MQTSTPTRNFEVPHITINGRPLCDHIACVAGLQDAAEVAHEEATLCGHVWKESAHEVAGAWRKAHPRFAVEVVLKPCPHGLRLKPD